MRSGIRGGWVGTNGVSGWTVASVAAGQCGRNVSVTGDTPSVRRQGVPHVSVGRLPQALTSGPGRVGGSLGDPWEDSGVK